MPFHRGLVCHSRRSSSAATLRRSFIGQLPLVVPWGLLRVCVPASHFSKERSPEGGIFFFNRKDRNVFDREELRSFCCGLDQFHVTVITQSIIGRPVTPPRGGGERGPAGGAMRQGRAGGGTGAGVRSAAGAARPERPSTRKMTDFLP